MDNKTRLVLLQYQEGSVYSDRVGEQYHFPKKYYKLLTLPNIEFIYYEPESKGKGVYFGYGEIGNVEPDPNDPEQYFAEIKNYHPFPSSVLGKDENGIRRETEPYFNAQNAVRRIVPEIFVEICKDGGIDLESLGVDAENVESDDRITKPFDPKKIKVDRESMSVFQALRKIELGDIKLNPEFQRGLVWDSLKRCRLIESALLRLPLPAFYFDGVNANQWTVVDGLQRLSTLHEFITKNSFRLHGLEYLGTEEGKTFSELPRGMQRELEETQITVFIIRPETPPDVKFTIFYRINTGGLVLTSQEIRHALFQGAATDLLKQLVTTPEFAAATDYGTSDFRMDARECILRFLAFHLQSYTRYDKSDLNGFLSNTMKAINFLPRAQIRQLELSFKSAMNRSHEIFGRYAFRKFNTGYNRRGPVNKALFESWANVLLEYPLNDLRDRKDSLIKNLSDAFYSDDYSRALSAGTGSVAAVRSRFQRAHEIVRNTLK